MTQVERTAYLESLLTTEKGTSQLTQLWHEAVDTPANRRNPATISGTSFQRMISEIVQAEYRHDDRQ